MWPCSLMPLTDRWKPEHAPCAAGSGTGLVGVALCCSRYSPCSGKFVKGRRTLTHGAFAPCWNAAQGRFPAGESRQSDPFVEGVPRGRISMRSGVPTRSNTWRGSALRKRLYVGDVLERIAVDDDDRRVHAALVGVAQLGAEHAGAFRRLELPPSCSRRVSTGVGILRVAWCASAIAPHRAQALPLAWPRCAAAARISRRPGASRWSAAAVPLVGRRPHPTC